MTDEILSLLVDEALKGVDVKTRYPDGYQQLLDNHELRQIFLDSLVGLEANDETIDRIVKEKKT
jgi:hypothetical protein